jgi:hypothetical protein
MPGWKELECIRRQDRGVAAILAPNGNLDVAHNPA